MLTYLLLLVCLFVFSSVGAKNIRSSPIGIENKTFSEKEMDDVAQVNSNYRGVGLLGTGKIRPSLLCMLQLMIRS